MTLQISSGRAGTRITILNGNSLELGYMARRTPDTTSKPPAKRGDGGTYFYAAEVVRVLGLQGIDYAQLRRILRLARPPEAAPDRKWARFTFEDLVAIRVAVGLAGGSPALSAGRRLQLAELERACARLRALGVTNPLLEVPLRREGRTIVAEIDGVTFRPATGQLSLADTGRRVNDFLAKIVRLDDASLRSLRSDVDKERRRIAQQARIERSRQVRGRRLAP